MSELRRDPITGRWVIFTPEHTRRPKDFTPALSERHETARFNGPALSERHETARVEGCPFCEGRESVAGWELLAWRPHGSAANTPGWDLRVVPNREPALRVESNLGETPAGLFARYGGLGAHEVVIESPRHGDTWPTMTADAVARVMWAWRERMRDLKRDFRLKSFVVVKNHGALAGGRLDHPHSQLVAFPIVPPSIEREVSLAARHFTEHAQCLFCDMIKEEIDLDRRLIASDEHALACAPFASRVPFETWVLPRVHAAQFEEASDALLLAVASRVQDALRRIDATLLNPSFNLVLHTSPVGDEAKASYHWHLEILPRLGELSGIEWGSGVFVNPVPPEEAAQVLREARIAQLSSDLLDLKATDSERE